MDKLLLLVYPVVFIVTPNNQRDQTSGTGAVLNEALRVKRVRIAVLDQHHQLRRSPVQIVPVVGVRQLLDGLLRSLSHGGQHERSASEKHRRTTAAQLGPRHRHPRIAAGNGRNGGGHQRSGQITGGRIVQQHNVRTVAQQLAGELGQDQSDEVPVNGDRCGQVHRSDAIASWLRIGNDVGRAKRAKTPD